MEIEKKESSKGEKCFKIFCEKHRPLKIVKEMQERDQKITEEIYTFCRTIEKCMEIDKRVSYRNSLKEPKVFKKEQKNVVTVKKWREKDKKTLFEQVKYYFLMMRKLRLNCLKLHPKG